MGSNEVILDSVNESAYENEIIKRKNSLWKYVNKYVNDIKNDDKYWRNEESKYIDYDQELNYNTTQEYAFDDPQKVNRDLKKGLLEDYNESSENTYKFHLPGRRTFDSKDGLNRRKLNRNDPLNFSNEKALALRAKIQKSRSDSVSEIQKLLLK